MPDPEPRIRVAFMRALVSSTERLEEPTRTLARDALADVTERVEAAPRLGWMSGDANFDAVDRLTEALGKADTRRFFRELFGRVWADSSFMSTFVQGFVRMHPDPGAYLKYLNPGFRQIFRGFGRWTVGERTANTSVAVLSEMPARCLDNGGAWIHYTAASLGTIYDLAGVEGHAKVVELDEQQLRATLRFFWSSPD
ncbi:MAG: hypothetical protein AAF799_01080 [Myxococcota bacterium]